MSRIEDKKRKLENTDETIPHSIRNKMSKLEEDSPVSQVINEVDKCNNDLRSNNNVSDVHTPVKEINRSELCIDSKINDKHESVSTPRWQNLKKILLRNGTSNHPDFHPSESILDQVKNVKVLIIGAGGLGCEILKNLALMGFSNLHVIDMDEVDLSNLNRQFLFRRKDIGRPKAEVAAEFIKKRVPSCSIKAYYNKIEDFDEDFYRSFNIVLCGLDSIAARRWINGMLLSLLSYDDDTDELDYSTIIPLIDGGTEGFKGNARVIFPGITPCIDCAVDLYQPQTKYHLCTLANTPRLPEHCVEYVKLILWPKENPWDTSAELDSDDPSHINWVYEKSLERASAYGITGITYRLVQGVVKNIIPAVASTNAVIAASCVTEAFKIVTSCYLPLNNHMILNDVDGIYSYSFELQRKEDCHSCSTLPSTIQENLETTLGDLLKSLTQNGKYNLNNPSITANLGGKMKTLYMPTIPSIEEKTRSNLEKSLKDLGFKDGAEFIVADKTSPKVLTFRLSSPKA